MKKKNEKKATTKKKSVIASKSLSQGREYVLMNMTEHITTRRQLNQLAQEALPCLEPNGNLLLSKKPTKKELTEDDYKRIKVEQQKLERERRMKEISKILEEKNNYSFSIND